MAREMSGDTENFTPISRANNIVEYDTIDGKIQHIKNDIETFKNSKELLRRLHVKEGKKVIQGAEAFLVLWKKIPKYPRKSQQIPKKFTKIRFKTLHFLLMFNFVTVSNNFSKIM